MQPRSPSSLRQLVTPPRYTLSNVTVFLHIRIRLLSELDGDRCLCGSIPDVSLVCVATLSTAEWTIVLTLSVLPQLITIGSAPDKVM